MPSYTDVHARLPALTLLIWISLLAAVILLINIRRRGWALPVLGVGLWAFVAIVVGAIYPAIVQAVKVTRPRTRWSSPTSPATSPPPVPPSASTT